MTFLATADAERLETDDTHLYFVDGSTIARASFAGGTVETLATNAFEPTDLAVDATHVYWSSKPGAAIQRVPKAGGAVELVATASSPGDIAEYGSVVYWLDVLTGGAEVVMQAAKTGGTPTQLTPTEFLYDLEADADGVYITQFGYTSVRFFPSGGGSEQALPCPAFLHCEDVEPAGDMLYSFARAANVIGGWGIIEVFKAPTAQHAFASVLNFGELATKLRADTKNAFVYFSTDFSAGAEQALVIRKAPKCSTGMSTDAVVAPLSSMRDFAIGAQDLYFSMGDGQIRRAPK